MKKIKFLVAVTAAGVMMSGRANASNYQFDENGNSYRDSLPTGFDSQLAADDGTGVITLDYFYKLDGGAFYNLQQGWVAIYNDPAQTELSDLIHFGSIVTIGSANHGNNLYQQIYFYSDDDQGTLADHWLSTSQIDTLFTGSSLVRISRNPDGSANYTPASSNPGYLNGGVPPELASNYTFLTSVPEPGAYGAFAGMLGLGCLGSGRMVKRWRGRHAAV